jgi:hemoglobin-like flavoprotein
MDDRNLSCYSDQAARKKGYEMTLTDTQIKLVQDTFALVAPQAEAAAQLFYGRLFELDPSLRHMFKTDMAEQGRKLMQMLSVAVHALERLDTIVPAVQALGERHVGYGVTLRHYAIVGEALLWTLEKGLGEAFTPEVKEAWATVYGILTQVATANLYPEAA